MLDKQMRLEELLGREVTIRWFEGVALIQAVCRQLLAHEGHHDAFPTAAEILLAADGNVAAMHASGRTAVRTAAQLLARMLSEDVPVRLRLIVAQATGADTAYPTLEEFSTALAYFERPDSNQVLRALFERAMAAPVRAAATEPSCCAIGRAGRGVPGPVTYSDAHLRLVVGAAVTAACVLAAWLGASAVDYSRLGVAFTSLAGSGSSSASACGRTGKDEISRGRHRGQEPRPTHGGVRTHAESVRPPSQMRDQPRRPAAAERATDRATAARTAATARTLFRSRRCCR